MATLITGGTGLIGACLAETLIARGETVALLDLAPADWRIGPDPSGSRPRPRSWSPRDAPVSLVYVEDVPRQFLALLDADPAVFARRRFFDTGGDTCTVGALAGLPPVRWRAQP